MMSIRYAWPLVAVLLGGCLSLPAPDIRERNALNLQNLRVGMTRQDVFKLMGTETETVQEDVFHEMRLLGYLPLTVSNPYKTVSIKKNGNRFVVLYYYAHPFGMQMDFWDTSYEKKDIPDDFLTPVVLKNGTLIGWGRGILEREGLKEALPPADDDWMMWGS